MTTVPAPGFIGVDESIGPTHAAFRRVRYFGSLDGLRCLSILAVLWHHSAAGVGWFPASHTGFLGVDMFFVVSGFLIVTLLLRERDREGEIAVIRFYGRRMLRLFPVYYGLLAVLTMLFVLRPDGQMGGQFFSELPYYLTHTSNWIVVGTFLAITWSLAAEEQFYLAWPTVMRYLRVRYELMLLAAVIVLNQMMAWGMFDGLTGGWLGVTRSDLPIMQATFTPLCLGVLLAHALHDPRGFRVMARIIGSRYSPIVTLALVVSLASLPGGFTPLTRLFVQLAIAAMVASVVIQERHCLSGVLGFKPIARIGVISYGMYLFHMIVLHVVSVLIAKLSLPAWGPAMFLLTTAGTIVVAECSYRFYETPFLRLKQRLSRADADPANAPVATAASLST